MELTLVILDYYTLVALTIRQYDGFHRLVALDYLQYHEFLEMSVKASISLLGHLTNHHRYLIVS